MTNQQVEAYLERIKYTGARELTAATLDALIWANVSTVPFENLDVYDLHMVPSLDPEDLYNKIVERRRGGYCFELNTLFGELLIAMGFPACQVVVRLSDFPDPVRPSAHKGLVVEAEGKQWYCDVGGGGHGPKGVVEIREGEQVIGGGTYRGIFRDRIFLLQRKDGEKLWSDVLSFGQVPAESCDFIPLNFYCARHERSDILKARMVNLTLPHGSKALTGSRFTLRSNGRVTKRDVASRKELLELLREEYGLVVDLPEDVRIL